MAGYNVDNILMNIFDKDDTKGKLSDKIPMITKEIEVLKNDMKSFLSTIEYDIPGIIEEGRELCVETKSLVDDMESCRLEIEEKTMAEMVKSLANRDQLAKELELVNFGINIIYDVVQCSKYIKECEDGKEAQSYSRCVEAVYDFIRFLDVPTEGFTELDIYPVYRNTADLLWDDLLKEVYAELAHLISWNVKTSAKKTIITITLDLPDTYEVVDVLVALDTCHKLAGKVSEFSQFLLKSVLIPMIKNECTVHGENDNVMKVTISHKEDYQPPYKTVFANLQLLFEFINEKLKLEFKTKRTLMQMVGLEIGHEFSKVLIRECLINTIPNTVTELLNYTEITIDVDNLQKFLYDISFFHDDISILSYLRKMDALFAKKSSQHFLERAREIMFKDLSVTMAIGVESIDDEAASSDTKAENAEALYILEKTIPKSLFYFPRCMISKTTQELLDLVYMMMEQASQCTGLVSKRLYNTTRLVFELYDAVVPYHHENYLQTIPQYVALFHNNCMYLAHHMQTFGDKWLNLKDGHQVDYPISFVDLVQKLRELGHKHLAIHMQQQRKQILDNIRSSDLNNIVVKDVLSENAEAAVRQCLRQLQLLKNVWIGVFPNNVFTRLMATLVNMFVDELIHRVCTVEDISMEIATQLTEMYTIVVQKAPLLFHEKTDIEQHVASWIKLQELIFVLGGSLKDIEAHWNDGTGPLALHFRTEELRSLIKALFQNTQMRANLLSKIK